MSDRIVTQRLLLRRPKPDDAEAMHAVLSHPAAMAYWSTEPHTELSQTREWLDRMIASPPEESDDFVVERQGRVIGKAGAWRLPEIGYILHPDYWGQGLAFEAMTVVVGRLFARFPIPAIEADVDPRNTASLALLERLGFAEAGRAQRTLKVGDQWVDSVYLTLPRPTETISGR